MSIVWCGICDDLNTKFQPSTYSSNYLRAPYHNFSKSYENVLLVIFLSSYSPRRTAFFTIIPSYFLFLRHIFSRLVNWNETFQLGPSFTTISIRALKSSVFNSLAFITAMSCWYVDVPHFVRANTRHHEGVSIYLVVYDMYICVPSYFNNKMFTIYFVELLGRSRLHTNQSWFLCSSMWSRCLFSPYLFKMPFFHCYAKSRS